MMICAINHKQAAFRPTQLRTPALSPILAAMIE